ncbi:MAG: host specificity protein, partial [Alphaproteobacteria bacterium]|nr:host specificity protein [Alphaproteobacteria bacterium]
MASVVLSVVGGAIAGPIGAAVGSVVGAVVDSLLVSALTPTQKAEGQRLSDIKITSATEGIAIPRVYGRARMGGNIIWATDFREEKHTTKSGGGKGGGGGVETTEYLYFASFAVALCEGPIAGIGRIWADGKEFKVKGAVYRVHKGTETQAPDTLIQAKMGTGNAPAYRGVAYIVFDDLPLQKFGNRIPQLTFEVFRPVDDPDSAEQVTRAVNLIPGAGEFVYAAEKILDTTTSDTRAENVNSSAGQPDLLVALD